MSRRAKLTRVQEALARIDQRSDLARRRYERSRHPYDRGEAKGLAEAAREVRRAFERRR